MAKMIRDSRQPAHEDIPGGVRVYGIDFLGAWPAWTCQAPNCGEVLTSGEYLEHHTLAHLPPRRYGYQGPSNR